MTAPLAVIVVVMAGLFMCGLGMTGFLFPAVVRRFLSGFAVSFHLHWVELAVRMIVGAAFILHAPHSRAPAVFLGFGWLLVGTTGVLALIPWRLHRKFAERTVPQALRYLPLLSGASLMLGMGVLFLALSGVAPR